MIMKTLFCWLLAFALAAPALAQEGARKPHRGYGTVKVKTEKHPNNKAHFRSDRARKGRGLDLHAHNQGKFATVRTHNNKFLKAGQMGSGRPKQRERTRETTFGAKP